MDDKIIYGLTCDHAFLDEQKKHNYIGVFDRITVFKKLDYRHLKFFLGIKYHTDSLKHSLTIKIRPPQMDDDSRDTEIGTGEVELKENGLTSVIIQIANFIFDKAGEWKVIAKIDNGNEMIVTRFFVDHAE